MTIWTIFANFLVFKLGFILEIEKSGSTAGISLRHIAKSGTYRTSHAEVFTRSLRLPIIFIRDMAAIAFDIGRSIPFTFAICYCPSVCRLSSVTLVRPTQAIHIFGNISTVLGTLAIRWHPLKISRRSSQGNTSAEGVKYKTGSQVYSDFGPIDGYISETVQYRR